MVCVPAEGQESVHVAWPVEGVTATLAQMVTADPPWGVSVKVTEPESWVGPVALGVTVAVSVTCWFTLGEVLDVPMVVVVLPWFTVCVSD